MTDTTADATNEATKPTDPAQGQQSTSEQPKAAETDWVAEARKWEKLAKENKSAATKLAEIEEANKTEAQKTADRIAALEREASTAKAEALRFKIAAKFQVSDEDADLFLTGTDEETLTKQAERLMAREAESGKPRAPKPNQNQGRTPDTATSLDPRAADLAQIESDLAAARR